MTIFLWIGLLFLVATINEVFSEVNMEVSGDVLKHSTVRYPITGAIYEFRIAAVSDLEKKSKSRIASNVWLTYLKKGCLIYNSNSQAISINWDSGLEKGEAHYTRNSNIDGRGFEMSEMVTFDNYLLAADDETGILYKYDKGDFGYWHIVPANKEGALGELPSEHSHGQQSSDTPKDLSQKNGESNQEVIESSGNTETNPAVNSQVQSEDLSQKKEESTEELTDSSGNNETNSAVNSQVQSEGSPQEQTNDYRSHNQKKIVAMNIEWATVKDGSLFVGPNGIGKSKFVAVIDKNKKITFEDWSKKFDKIKEVAGIKEGGYMTFESCEWSKVQNKFFFLPKTASDNAYNRSNDPHHGSNLIVSASPDFDDVKKEGNVTEIHTDRGYSSFKFLPYTKDQIIVALQTSEITNETHIIAFNTSGHVLYKPTKVADIKFEGFEFV